MRKATMKKSLSFLLAVVLTFSMLAGCSKKDTNKETNSTETTNEDSTDQSSSTTDSTSQTSDTTEATNESTTEATTEKLDINIAALKGPTSMGMVKMMKDASNGQAANNYKFTIAGTAEEISAKIVSGEFDIAAIPCNLASVLYNKSKGGIVVAGINTLGVLYIVETGDQIKSVKDLKGKTIYSTGKGTTPEYTLNYLLTANGLDPNKDVTIEYKSEPTEVAAILSDSKNAIAMLPQPYVTTVMMQNKSVKVALDVAEEWNKLSDNGSTVVTGVIAVNKAFLDKNKEAVDAFLAEYEKSAQFANDNVKEAAALIEEFGIFKAAIAEKALPACNITSIQGDEMQTKISGYLQALFAQNPASVGGALPDDAFYYKK